MTNKPHIPYQQFVQKYASEFYLTEQKRKAYYPKLAGTTVATIGITFTVFTIALNVQNAILGNWLLASTGFILLAGLVVGILFWNQFRTTHKEQVIKMLVEEYFPQLQFTYLKKPGIYKPSNYINGIAYWPEHHKIILKTQDFIEGPIGKLEIMLFEALLQHKDSSDNTKSVFDGIILEIRNVPETANFEEIKSRTKIKKALNDIFDFYKYDYPTLFSSPNGNWYVFLEHSKTYLEPKGIKKSWSQEELERLLGEFYYFIRFAEVLEAELAEYQALPSPKEE